MDFDLNTLQQRCPCGQSHTLQVRDIWLERGAIDRMPSLLCAWERPAVLFDENTYKAAGERIGRVFRERGLTLNPIILPPKGLHANEHGVALAEGALSGAEDLLIAAGSGTIHDITRYLANKRDIPFISVPTAASVDGFVSTVAAMTWDNCKKTFPAVAPLYVFADTDVFSAAPPRLTASGFGDLLGKYTALADWRIANLLTGEYYCDRVAGLMQKAVKEAVEHPEDTERLMYGLLLSGLAMQMVGNSRPASGAEHHLSHFWEMEVQNGPMDALHGEKVGVGLLLCARKYHSISAALKEGSLGTANVSGLWKKRS
jgi:glycerol-1-phosphate dehydrogenase [NAD(P)+]